MDRMTPEQGIMIVLLALAAMGISIAYQCRADLAALFRRYVHFSVTVPAAETNERGRRPDAAEQAGNTSVPTAGDVFRDLVADVNDLTEDERLTLLALLVDDDGDWLYAETRVARFIGGRVEDRQAQVRKARGEDEPPAPPARVIPHRVNGEERRLVLD